MGFVSLFSHPQGPSATAVSGMGGEWKIVWSASSRGGAMSEDIGYV